ncbi:MAG: hypothetical protein ACRBC3_00225 [Burkholderiaceae bacterium]
MNHIATDQTTFSGRLCFGLVLGLALVSLDTPVFAQRNNQLSQPAGNGATFNTKTDWSGKQQQTDVNSSSQPTRFDVKSSIPDSRTGNDQFQVAPVSRERGGPLLDRLQTTSAPGRATPITR